MSELKDCFGTYNLAHRSCKMCMIDVHCYAAASCSTRKDTLPVLPPYSRKDAAKRMILAGQLPRQRIIADLMTAYNMSQEAAKTHVREAIATLDYFCIGNYAQRGGIDIYTIAVPPAVAFVTRKLLLDDRNRNYFLDVTLELEKPFIAGSDVIEKAPSLPKQCRTIICMGYNAEMYAKRSATKVMVSFTGAYQPPTEAFWNQENYASSFQVWKYFMTPLIVGIFKR